MVNAQCELHVCGVVPMPLSPVLLGPRGSLEGESTVFCVGNRDAVCIMCPQCYVYYVRILRVLCTRTLGKDHIDSTVSGKVSAFTR